MYEKSNVVCCRVASFVTISLLKRKPTLAKKIILTPILDTIRSLYNPDLFIKGDLEIMPSTNVMENGMRHDLNGNKIIVNQSIFGGCLQALTFLIAMEPLPILLDQLTNVFPYFLTINLFAEKSKLLVNHELAELVKLLITLHKTPATLLRCSFEKCIIYSAGGISKSPFVCKLVSGDDGGIMFTLIPIIEDETSQEKITNTIIDPNDLISFLIEKQNDIGDLTGDFFIEIVESHLRLQRNHQIEPDSDDDMENDDDDLIRSGSKIDDAQHRELVAKHSTDILVMYATLILQMLEKLGDSLLTKTFQILKFVKLSLLDDDSESINLGLTLLTYILETSKEDEEEPIRFHDRDVLVLKDILVILSTLTSNQDRSVSALASLARMKLLGILTSTTDNHTQSFVKNQISSESLALFRSGIKDLSDELIPNRAHGISSLTGLILSKDPVATIHIETICSIFFDLLSDEDSFIYLNAVKGCSALTDMYPSQSIEPLTNRYKSEVLSSAYRTRIGEVLLRSVQRLGSTISFPHHAKLLVQSILRVMKSSDAELQSSALVLCSQIIRQDPMVLQSCIHQLFDYINYVLARPTLFSQSNILNGTLLVVYELVMGFGVDLENMVGDVVVYEKTVRFVEAISSGASGDVGCQGHAERITSVFKRMFLLDVEN